MLKSCFFQNLINPTLEQRAMRTAGVARPASLARLEREVETLAMDLAVLEELQQRVCPQLDWEDLDSDVKIHSATNALRNAMADARHKLQLRKKARSPVGQLARAFSRMHRMGRADHTAAPVATPHRTAGKLERMASHPLWPVAAAKTAKRVSVSETITFVDQTEGARCMALTCLDRAPTRPVNARSSSQLHTRSTSELEPCLRCNDAAANACGCWATLPAGRGQRLGHQPAQRQEHDHGLSVACLSTDETDVASSSAMAVAHRGSEHARQRER